MKILTYTHHLEIGGSQTNAIDLATSLRDLFGHDITFCATPGPAAEIIDQRGFRLMELPRARSMPSPTVGRLLYRISRSLRPDLIHAYEDQQILDTFFGAHLLGRFPMLGTVMSMRVHRMLPRTIPLTYGTEALAEAAGLRRPAPVWLLEPPVNTNEDHPGAVDTSEFSGLWIDPDAVNIVVVSRLISWLKGEGLLRAFDAVEDIVLKGHRLRLIVVGGGPLLTPLSQRADDVNASTGGASIVLTGPLLDPRPAYAAADVVLGMGGSALRGMSFRKPVVVLGENGFSEVMSPASAPFFSREGIYGVGDGRPADLATQILNLVVDPDLRDELAAFSYDFVTERYGIGNCAASLDLLYRRALGWRPGRSSRIADVPGTASRRAVAALPDTWRDRGRRILASTQT